MLFNLFLGKNTLETARILVDVFVGRFGECWGTREDILKSLLPKGRASTWGDLDKRINVFAKRFYQANMEKDKEQGEEWNDEQNDKRNDELSEKIKFLDEIRFVLQDLPRRQDYKLPEGKEEYPTSKETAFHFVCCSLCWRSVVRLPLEKKTPLCHIHDLPSSSPAYRRRARMRAQVEVTKLRLVKALPSLFELRRGQGVELKNYLLDLCLSPASPLPYLVGYLQALSCTTLLLPLQTEKDILQALEYPIYFDKITARTKEAWDCYFDDRSQHFRLNYVRLLTAEAWLEVEAKSQHGGKRR
jgi:hypothetical protein